MYRNSYADRGNQRSNQTKTKDAQSPLDTVSSLLWHKYSQETMFFATSWDGYVRCYMVKNSNYSGSSELQLAWKMFLSHPVLCCDIHPDNILLIGMATGDIVAINLADSQMMRVGGHDAPICGLFWLQQNNMLISLGFDNLVRFWQLGKGDKSLVGQIKLGLKTHTTSYDPPYLLIGSSQGTISIVNLKNLQHAKFPKESQHYLKTTIQMFSKFNCSSISSVGKMLAVGTIDGRTLLSKFRESYDEFTIEPIVFKSQKKTESRGLSGQINCVDIGYRNSEGFYLIGGSEDLAAYNLKKRSKVCQFALNKAPATSVRMHPSLDIAVYASGTDWMRGIQEFDNIKRPRIYLRKMAQSQIKQLTNK